MKYKHLLRPGLLLPILLAGCSTTKNLPADEQLYIGIDKISYDGLPLKAKEILAARQDSVGVITSIADAVTAVADVLGGRGTGGGEQGLAALQEKPGEITREERRAIKKKAEAEAKAFKTAKTEVEAVLAYPPNNALFGSSSLRSPFPVGLWIYNSSVNHQHGLGKWFFKNFAATPVYLSAVNPETRARVATNTLRNYGYFSGRVTPAVVTQKNPRKAKVAYDVYAGPVHRFDSIAYLGFPPHADSLLRSTDNKRILHRGEPFTVFSLSAEQARIERLFRENGYYFYSAPYTTFRADTLMRPGYVQLRVSPSESRPAQVRHQWYMGNTYVTMHRAEGDVLDRTLRRRAYTYTFSGKKPPLSFNMWRRAISHRKGEMYRQSNSDMTLEKLGRMGVFSQLDVSYVPRDTTPACDTLDIYVSAVMDKLYDSSFEMNATLKSNQQVGPGLAYSLAKRNAFGAGEKVSFKVFGSYEWQTGLGRSGGKSLLNSYELGTELAFEFPRCVLPFIGRRHLRFPASTTFSLNSDWRNRANFFQMMTFGAGATYKWNKFSTSQHELTVFSLDFNKLLHKTSDFDSIMTANPALYVSMRDQFVPSLSYTFIYASAPGHRNPVWVQLGVKEAGNLTSGIYAATGRSWNERDKSLFGSPFAQFMKFTAEFHETFRINSRMNIATRLFGGVVYSYGNSDRAPYADQFYVGGANSVRAFTVRTIGPGSFRGEDTKYSYIDQTGDVKLEANVEFRSLLFGSLHGAVFLDAGNVWLLRDNPMRPGGKLTSSTLKNIAVGTGAGLRYDLQFLVLRLDVGIGLHAPYDTGKGGFYNIPRFSDGLAFHFAIGYPF